MWGIGIYQNSEVWQHPTTIREKKDAILVQASNAKTRVPLKTPECSETLK
jgi:hypothetical protein